MVASAHYAVVDAGAGATMVLQAWSAAVAPRKRSGGGGKKGGEAGPKSGGGGGGGGSGVAGNTTLAAAVSAAAAVTSAAVSAVVAAATPHAGTEAEEAAAIAAAMDAWSGADAGSAEGGRVLGASASSEVATRVVSSQRTTLSAVRDHGGCLVAQLAVLSAAARPHKAHHICEDAQ